MTSTTETENFCRLKSRDFQTTIDGKNIDFYILKSNVGNEMAIANYGGAVVAIVIPDKEGKLANVIQGHDNTQDVIDSPEPYLSTLIGRYGNRIAKGRFRLRGKECHLPINDGPNCLHGGNKGFNACVWNTLQMDDQTLVLRYVSPYGEEGFSGELRTTVVYSFNSDSELSIEYMSTINKKTIINFTSHGSFSLPGIANPTPIVENQICGINVNYYIPIDDTSIPTGEIRFVEGAPFDFRQPKSIGQDTETDDIQIKNGAGYDHCFVLNKKEEGELGSAARLTDPTSRRITEVYTTEPGVQLYADNWADGYEGQHGATFPRRSAIYFEAQHFPDSPNHLYFPSVVLRPSQEYKQKTVYKFYTQE